MRSPQEIRTAMNQDIPMSEYLPLGGHITDNVIRLKDTGDYLAIWRVTGITFETSDEQELGIRKDALNTLWRNLGSDYAVWSYRVRRQVRERLDGTYDNEFCQQLDERYSQSLDEHKQMRTELYLAVIYKPATDFLGSFGRRLAVRTRAELARRQSEALDTFADTAKLIEGMLERYEPVRLGCFERNGVRYTEMGTFLGLLLNGTWEDVPVQSGRLSNWLPNARLFFGEGNGLCEFRHHGKTKFAGFMDMQEYPVVSTAGMNKDVMFGDFEFIEAQSFTMMPKRKSIESLSRQKGQLMSSGDASDAEIDDMDGALDLVRDGILVMGEYHYTLAVFGADLHEVSDNLASARKCFEEGPGYKMALIDAVPEAAWLSMVPGNWKYRPRAATISSLNFSAFSCLHNFAAGKRTGNPWGEALALMRSTSGQPYYLNLHVSPEGRDCTDEKLAGNTFVCGSTGVGKTTTVAALLALSTKVEGLRVMVYDKDRGCELSVRAMGGRYYALRKGEPTGFNPFQLEPTAGNLIFLEKLVATLVRGEEGAPLTEAERMEISAAVRTVMSDQVSPSLRRLSAVYQNLRNLHENDVRQRLTKWIYPNALGWVFDNNEDTIDLSTGRVFGFDYTEFLGDDELSTPIVMYLLHIQERLLDGRPFIMAVEEFWMPARNPTVAAMFLDIDKTIRKKSGLRIYLTQSPSDAVDLPIGKTLVEQSNTCIYLPNPRADYDDYVNGFKVTEAEFNTIRGLGETSRMFLVKQGHRSAIVKFDLGNMPDLINILSGSTDNVALFDDLCESQPGIEQEPSRWIPELQSRISERKARKLATTTRSA